MKLAKSVSTSALILAVSIVPASSKAAKEHTLVLQFVPQEATGSSEPSLANGMEARPVRVAFEDKRPQSELAVVGEGTDDDDRLFPWRTDTPITEFARGVLLRTFEGWGIRIQDETDLLLVVRLSRFFVSEKDQAVGSNYTADVRLAFELKGRDDVVLSSGVASGSARRYGRARSSDNCNEVLSDALKEACANLLSDSALQVAWTGKGAPARLQGSTSPKALLEDVVGLQKQGIGPELLISYINQRILSTPFTAQDLIEWKSSGLPEAAIKAAMDRPVAGRKD